MIISKTFSATLHDWHGTWVEIESTLQKSLPKVQITGLANEVVKESTERITACLLNLGFNIPSSKIVVHLSPAQEKKMGSQLDLGIALSLLGAEGLIPSSTLSHCAFLGELSLDGRVRSVPGLLTMISCLEEHPEVTEILIPKEDAFLASLINSKKTRLIETLSEAIDFIHNKIQLSQPEPYENFLHQKQEKNSQIHQDLSQYIDYIHGQKLAKRALLIALSGKHHLLLIGSQGIGKSSLLQGASHLLPGLTREEKIELIKINASTTSSLSRASSIFNKHPHNSNGHYDEDAFLYNDTRPLRMPHHTVSGTAFLGGGTGTIIPGEITLAHRGILFMDEFPEFRKESLEGLREPLQNGSIHLHRTGKEAILPSKFILIAAMNPCPCGNRHSKKKPCTCSDFTLRKYLKRISGPILDRIDMACVMNEAQEKNLDFSKPSEDAKEMNHLQIKKLIKKVWAIQARRKNSLVNYSRDGAYENEQLFEHKDFVLDTKEKDWLSKKFKEETISYRGLKKIIHLSRTIADLEDARQIKIEHLEEAWHLKCFRLCH